ncbi:P1 [Brassica yellows virus]|uniref:P1 n=1 Tax=Brassica yellows virus TaxID=1046403 RepID=G3E223_9VIRU|nr:P1 [Brassica yellows virus]ADW41584.1 P1 [Brassica yellows virus]
MNSRLIFLFALCSISFLSFSETTSTMTLGSPYLSLNQSSAPGSLYKRDMLPPPPQAVLTYTCQEPRPLVEESYNDLLRAISQKSSSDFQNVYSLALNISSDFCLLGLEMLKDASFLAVEKFLWGLTRLWSSLMLASFSALWWLMSNFTTPVFCLALLYTVTRFMVKMVSFLFGGLPIWIISIAFSLLKKSFSALRSTPKCLYEKAIDGFKSFTIPQSPPKTCVIPITHASGNHAGYASCVKLYNGENALLTATHVLRDCPNAIAVSARGLQARIPLAEFKTIAKSDKGDVTLLRGPPNWEGLLGCKAANVITAANLAKCKATIYSLEKDGWACGYAEIVGSDGTDAMVLSQTEEGHSGSPYFNGKTVLGVHSGASKKRNYNLMAPIPSIPGLTSPTYVFETTAPQGRIFAQEDVAEIENLYSGYKRLQNFKSKTGTNWGDMSEDDDIFFESKEDFSGNGVRGADRETNGEGSSTPKTNNVDGKEMMEKIISSLVGKINLENIEKKVVEQISAKAMKTSRPHRRRAPKKQPESSKDTSPHSTTGRYQPPHVRSPASVTAASCPNTTTPSKRKNHAGGRRSSGSIPHWVRKQAASAGPSSAPKQN